jgi:Beta/Gamma crystallin
MKPGFRRRLGALFIGLAVLVLGAWQRAEVRRPPLVRSGIVVFEDADYGGRSRAFNVDVADLRASGLNDHISSVAVAPGEEWQLCVDRNYSGRCMLVTGNDRNLHDSGWNDRISSMRRVRVGSGFPGGGRGDGIQTLELFAGTSYSGQRKVISGPVANFRDIDFNDRAMSVRTRGGASWELCVGANYDDCRVVSGDVPDLESLGLRRLVSSARPRAFGRGRGGFPPPPVRMQIVLFEGPNFTGRSITLDDARPSLGSFNNRAQSLQVVGGRWELCDGPRYGGRCATVVNSVRSLSELRLDRRIQSVRPR